MGTNEQYYNGVHFQIQEFCVKTSEQRKGYGTALLRALKASLFEAGISNIYLITSKGERTEGYYSKRGFTTSEYMILMSDNDLKNP